MVDLPLICQWPLEKKPTIKAKLFTDIHIAGGGVSDITPTDIGFASYAGNKVAMDVYADFSSAGYSHILMFHLKNGTYIDFDANL